MIAVKLNRDGSLDPNFGRAGVAISSTPLWHYSSPAFGMGADGRYWIAGHWLRPRQPQDPRYRYDYGLSVLLADGTIDASFGAGGIRVVSVGAESDSPHAVVVRQDGRPIVIGDSANRPGRQIVAIGF